MKGKKKGKIKGSCMNEIIEKWVVPKDGHDHFGVLYKCQCYYLLFTLSNDKYLQSISLNTQDVMCVIYVIYWLVSNFMS